MANCCDSVETIGVKNFFGSVNTCLTNKTLFFNNMRRNRFVNSITQKWQRRENLYHIIPSLQNYLMISQN